MDISVHTVKEFREINWPSQFEPALQIVIQQFELDIDDIHGLPHWFRVLQNGWRLAVETGADLEVVTAFAFFHDCRRLNDGYDPEHGLRGAEYAREVRQQLPNLLDEQFDLLYEACRYHSDGMLDADITIQTCWDSDRLDLGRVEIMPKAELLCTQAARQEKVIEDAWTRSRLDNKYLATNQLSLHVNS
jgi:uncharacterized protein